MLARLSDSELDPGPAKAGAERLCIVSRVIKPVGEMIRFVVAPDGSVIPDLKQNLPGRGVWVTATRSALVEAVRKKMFARGFKADVKDCAILADFTDALLQKAALDTLAMAGKAGCAVTGFGKVEAALQGGKAVAVLHSRDAAADGIRKILAILRGAVARTGDEIVLIDEFGSEQLDLALGRSNVVHAALLAGPAGQAFLMRLQRLRRFRAGDSGKPEHGETRHNTARRLDSE